MTETDYPGGSAEFPAPPPPPPPMPRDRVLDLLDRHNSTAAPEQLFPYVAQVEEWPRHLAHYRYVKVRERQPNGVTIVEMAAWRPFGVLKWPTWWLSRMTVHPSLHLVRFTHIGGATTGMDVEWRLVRSSTGGTEIHLLHVWDGPRWPVISHFAARAVIGPHFVHAIAARTMAGLATAAERGARS